MSLLNITFISESLVYTSISNIYECLQSTVRKRPFRFKMCKGELSLQAKCSEDLVCLLGSQATRYSYKEEYQSWQYM